MLIGEIDIYQVDYVNIAERFLPEAFKSVSDESKLSMRIGKEFLVNNKTTSNMAKGLLKIIPQQAKDSLALDLVTRNKDKIADSMNKSLIEKQIDIRIRKLNMIETNKAVKGMIKLEVILDEIDYESVIASFLPKLIQAMVEKGDKQGKLAEVLLGMKEVPNQMLTAALAVLPQEAKDELVVKIMSIYKEDIIDSLNHMANEQQITAVISEVNIKSIL